MNQSKNNLALITAVKKGYFTDIFGNVFYKGKKRKLILNKSGYYIFNIRCCIENEIKSWPVKVHRLQAFTKFGEEMFINDTLVRHKNGNPIDNSFNNILIGTPSENMMDVPCFIRKNRSIKASKIIRRFTDDEVKNIKLDKSLGVSYKKLCIKYNTSLSTLSYLFNKAEYAK